MLTDWLEIENGKIKAVDFSGTVTVAEGFNKNYVLLKISSAISEFLNVDTRDMGQPIRISDLYALIDNIDGVDFVELDYPKQTVTPENNELLVLGNIDFRSSA